MRICTGDVWVRSTTPESGDSTKNVSCIDRAGWSGPRFSASKLCHSDLDLGAVDDVVAHGDEDVGHALLDRGERDAGRRPGRGRTAS